MARHAAAEVPRRILLGDAANRLWRTALQGLVAAALVGGGTAAYDALHTGRTDYRNIAFSAATAALMAVLAYAHRRWLDPSSTPSAAPPADTILAAPGAAAK